MTDMMVTVASAGIKPLPVRGGVNVGLAAQGDTLTPDTTWIGGTMTSGASAGRKGWLLSSVVAPARTRIALGIYAIDTVAHGWRDSWASEQGKLVGTAPRIVQRFIPWSLTPPEGAAWAAWDSAWADDALACGAMPLLSWEGRDISQPITAPQPRFSNQAVLSGLWDQIFIAFLKAVGAWDKPITLRLDHEGNGLWFPWAAGTNGNTPESAIAAFRYKARLIRRYAANARILWTPGTSGGGWLPLEDCYPGSNYVDYLGADFYNTSDLPGGWSTVWTPLSGFKPYYDRICALDPRKPLILAEMGSVPQAGHDKAAWYAALPADCAAMPRIAGLVAFDNTYGNLDFRVSADPAVYAAWKALAALPAMQGTLL